MTSKTISGATSHLESGRLHTLGNKGDIHMLSQKQHNFASGPDFSKHWSRIALTVLVGFGIIAETALAESGVTPQLSGVYTIQQRSNGRYMDAHQNDAKDWAVVTRPRQDNATQKWIFSRVNNSVYTIQQQSNGRYVDAHDTPDKDYAVVTRAAQNNATQRWVLTKVGNNTYTIQQQNTGRYIDAHEYEAKDWAIVKRPGQPNSTQQWVIRRSN